MVSYSLKAAIVLFALKFIVGCPTSSWQDNDEIKRFREYLRFNTSHPNINYEESVKFLKCQGQELGLPTNVYYMTEGKPVVVITWPGIDSCLPSIMLNSHMDVVPVEENFWTYPPFGAEIDSDGRIYARGTQDTKAIGMQYLAAIRALMAAGVKLKRTLHVTFVPDEETGGFDGMEKFVKRNEFKDLNVGFALDEGGAYHMDEYPVFYAERSPWRLLLRINGISGHGSIPYPGTAGEKLQLVLDRIMEFRKRETGGTGSFVILTGNTTTINLTKVQGGIASNVLPAVIEALFDIRVGPFVNQTELEETINGLLADIEGVEIEYTQKSPASGVTSVDESNKYWLAFKSAMDEMCLVSKPVVFSATTDSRLLRELDIPVFGFTPMANTVPLPHSHNEYVSAETYLKGIEIYQGILKKIGNLV